MQTACRQGLTLGYSVLMAALRNPLYIINKFCSNISRMILVWENINLNPFLCFMVQIITVVEKGCIRLTLLQEGDHYYFEKTQAFRNIYYGEVKIQNFQKLLSKA